MITFRAPHVTYENAGRYRLEVWHVGFLQKYRPAWWLRPRLPWSARVPAMDHGCRGSNDKAYGWTKAQAIRRAVQLHEVGCRL